MNNLKSLILKAGLTGPRLAKLAGCSNVEIWRLTKFPEQGGRKLTSEWANRLAPYLNVTPQELLFPSGNNIAGLPDISFAKVRGEAEPGRRFEEEVVDEDYQYIPKIPGNYGILDQYAFKIIGNSMDQKGIKNGDYVICADYFETDRKKLTTGDIVIAEFQHNNLRQRMCSELIIIENGYKLAPSSSDVRWGEITVINDEIVVSNENHKASILGLVIGVLSIMRYKKT